MSTKQEDYPELKRFLFGSLFAFLLFISSIFILKYFYHYNLKYNTGRIPIIYSFIFTNSIGFLIYRKRIREWPHFWAGTITYFIIAAALSGLFYMLD